MSPRPDEFVLRDAGVTQEWCDGGVGMMPIRFVIESGGSDGCSSDCILCYSAKGPRFKPPSVWLFSSSFS